MLCYAQFETFQVGRSLSFPRCSSKASRMTLRPSALPRSRSRRWKPADLSDAFLCRSGHRTIRVEEGRAVWSPLKLRPAATLGYPVVSRRKDSGKKGWERRGLGSGNDGRLPTDYLGPHFGDGGANDGNDVSFGPSDVLRIPTVSGADRGHWQSNLDSIPLY